MNNELTFEELLDRYRSLGRQPTTKELNQWDRERLKSLSPQPHPPSSGLNEELLKQAIADAKAVRATALANAKAALEEAFREKFEEKFAQETKRQLLLGEDRKHD